MRIAYLTHNVDRAGDIENSVVRQANALAVRNSVEVLSLYRSEDTPYFDISPDVRIRHLVSVQGGDVRLLEASTVPPREAAALHRMESLLGPRGWTTGLSSLTDIAVERALYDLKADVVITTSAALLALAVRFAPPSVVVVHQEHRASKRDAATTEPLLTFGPLADLITVLNQSEADWVRGELGSGAPPVELLPHPLVPGFRPQSLLTAPLMVAPGPLTADQQPGDLVRALALVRDRLPEWRLRIYGDGPRRLALEMLTRRLKLFDRVELPGRVTDMRSEWAKAGVAVLAPRTEGMPLGAIDAMAAGVPVVSYDCPAGPRELISHERTGLLVPPDSVSALASAVVRLAEDHELRIRLGAEARRRARDFEPDVVAERWEKLLHDVAVPSFGRTFRSRVLRRAEHVRMRLAREAEPVDVASPEEREERDEAPKRFAPLTESSVTPAAARAAALSWAVATAERASATWFVMPSPWGTDEPSVVLPASRRTAFLDEVGRAGAPNGLYLHDEGGHGWPERYGPVREMSRNLQRGQTAQVGLQIGPREGLYREGCRVRVEFWESVEGTLITPRPNPYVTRVPADVPLVTRDLHGVEVRTLNIMAEPTVLECTFPIDVVYTWVDGDDPEWSRRRARRLAALGGPLRVEAGGSGRYTSRDELRYSMRSVYLYAPWVRHVYLVTDQQVPPWLDTNHPQITVVDHREILDPQHLPTFNSHAIETGLHHIDGLADQFIYFNDDVFLAKPVGKHRFFTASGQPAAYFAPQPVGIDNPDALPYLLAASNNRQLLRRDFGRTITSTLLHTPHPQRRSVLYEVEKRYPEEIRRTAAAPFRSPSDIALLTSLAQHYALLTGQCVTGDVSSTFVSLNSVELGFALERILKDPESETFCLGDYHEYAVTATRVDRLIDEFLKACFPIAAPWELPGS